MTARVSEADSGASIARGRERLHGLTPFLSYCRLRDSREAGCAIREPRA